MTLIKNLCALHHCKWSLKLNGKNLHSSFNLYSIPSFWVMWLWLAAACYIILMQMLCCGCLSPISWLLLGRRDCENSSKPGWFKEFIITALNEGNNTYNWWPHRLEIPWWPSVNRYPPRKIKSTGKSLCIWLPCPSPKVGFNSDHRWQKNL